MPKKLNILFIEPCPVFFGGYFRALNICQGLCHAGHRVDLLVSSNKKFFFRIEKQTPTPGLNLYILPRFFVNWLIQGRFLRATIAIYFGLTHNYDIYHFAMPSSPESNIPALFFKLLNYKHLVIDWDDIYAEGTFKNTPIYGRYIKFFESNYPHIFKNYSATSQYLINLAVSRGATHVIKIINGVNPNQFRKRSRANACKSLKFNQKYKYLLAVGNTFDGPRGTLLLHTFQELIRLDNSYRLLVNFDPKTVKYPLPKNIFDKIISVGFIPPSDLGKYMAVCQGSLFLSNSSPMEKAGYPIRVGSSLNGSLPIFSIKNNTEVSHTIEEFKCGIQAKDPVDLARQIIKVTSNKKLFNEIKSNTTKARGLLSINTLAKQLATFYYSLES